MASDFNDLSDHAIDAAVRDVPVPESMGVKPAAEALFSDAALDGLVRAVPVPPQFVDRLRAGLLDPSADRRGLDLDRLAAVVAEAAPGISAGAILRGAQATPRRRRGRLVRWGATLARDVAAVAASLACLAGLFVAGVQVSERLAGEAAAPPRQPVAAVLGDAPRGVPPAAPARGDDVPPATAARDVDPSVEMGVAQDVPAAPPESGGIPPIEPAAAALTVLGAGGMAGPGGGAAMRLVSPAAPSRRHVPRVREFDLGFEIRHGEAPFIDPAAATTLSIDEPPLSTWTDSFDAALDMIEAGQRPSPGMVRAEHVMAAMTGDRWPADGTRRPGAAVAVRGVQSLRRGPASIFVEVVVTAPPLAAGDRPALDAVVVLDRSVHACGPATWRSVCRALGVVADQMRPDDRVTLVDAAGPRLIVDSGDADAVREAGLAIRDLPAVWAADLDAAFRLAAGRRRSAGPCVVVSTRDSLERSRDEAAAAFLAWQRGAGEHDRDPARDDPARAAFVLIDAVQGDAAPSPRGSRGHVAADSRSIRIGLLEGLFRRSAVTLRECRLAVEMNPGGVALYRIVGHRNSAVESVSSGGVEPIDLHAGETVRVVYELVPRTARAAAAWLVRARLQSRAANGSGHAATASDALLHAADVEPARPVPSRQACEMILAVEVAEWLAGSPHAAASRRDSRALADLLEAWEGRGDVTPFAADGMAWLERARAGSRGKASPFDAP